MILIMAVLVKGLSCAVLMVVTAVSVLVGLLVVRTMISGVSSSVNSTRLVRTVLA